MRILVSKFLDLDPDYNYLKSDPLRIVADHPQQLCLGHVLIVPPSRQGDSSHNFSKSGQIVKMSFQS